MVVREELEGRMEEMGKGETEIKQWGTENKRRSNNGEREKKRLEKLSLATSKILFVSLFYYIVRDLKGWNLPKIA